MIARNTAFSYNGKPFDVRRIGREFGVRYALEGSVRRVGKQVRVNVQLLDAETGAHLWADRFDTDRVSPAKAQNEITGRLARMLNLQLVAAAARRIERQRPAHPDARDLEMRGWAACHRPKSPATTQEEVLGQNPKMGGEDQIIVARALHDLLERIERRYGVAKAKILREAGIGGEGDSTKHLSQYAIPGDLAREELNRRSARLRKKPGPYVKFAEAAASFADDLDEGDTLLEVFGQASFWHEGVREAASDFVDLTDRLRLVADQSQENTNSPNSFVTSKRPRPGRPRHRSPCSGMRRRMPSSGTKSR